MIFERSELKLMLGALAGICLSNFAIFSGPLYIGGLVDGMGFDEAQAGLVNTLEVGTVAIVTLVLSNWLGRTSLRYLAMAGAATIVLANLVTFSLESYLPLLTARSVAGAGAGLCLAVSSALLSRMADPDRALGILLASNSVIMIMSLMAMGYAKAQWMFSGFVGLFTVVALLLFPLLFLVPAKPFAAGQEKTRAIAATNHRLSLGGLGIVVLFFFCVIEGSVWAFSERSGSNLGIADGDIGLLLGLAQAAGLVGAMVAAVFGEKIPRILPICAGILLLGTSALTIYHTQSTFLYAASLATFSFGFFIAFPYLIGACARLDQEGRWAARATGTTLLGGAIAPFVAGNIIIASTYQMLGWFCFALAFLCMGLALLFIRKMNRADLAANSTLPGLAPTNPME